MTGALDPSLRTLRDCGCCAGVAAATPAMVQNRPGLSVIAYRVGTHNDFKQSMLAALSNAGLPALAELTTREDDDFTIGLLDAWAMVADVLTFYQERIANESYLRTATERLSVLQLARLIGYELRPGAAATTCLAFTLDDSQGSPGQTTIDVGVKVQSVPGPGETAQTFETIQAIDARPQWNALLPLLTQPQQIVLGLQQAYLMGNPQLQPGDRLLFVGADRDTNTASHQWDVRIVTSATFSSATNQTLVVFDRGLGKGSSGPAADGRPYVFRQRAAIFGYNAPDWYSVSGAMRIGAMVGAGQDTSNYFPWDPSNWPNGWPNFSLGTSEIDLDAAYPKILPQSWVALDGGVPGPGGVNDVVLFKATTVSSVAITGFGISSKSTTLSPDSAAGAANFSRRKTTAFAQSELLQLSEMPLVAVSGALSELLNRDGGVLAPVEGKNISLDSYVPDLRKGRLLGISGKRPRAVVSGKAGPNLTLIADDQTVGPTLQPGDSLLVMRSVGVTGQTVNWRLLHRNGFEGVVKADLDEIHLAPSLPHDETIGEIIAIDDATGLSDINPRYTRLDLGQGLVAVYDRSTVTISANVAPATHGETVQEVLGGGDASQTFQQFVLRQSPLTFLSAANETGVQSTLQLRMNDVLWHEQPWLLNHGPTERIFITRNSDDQKTTVEFGDGVTGARTLSGSENITAVYRKGIGSAGLVKAAQLSQLITRPLGVKGVTNPVPGIGGQDPEVIEDARTNAPTTVKTLGRVVSLEDYQDFAGTFPGIGKALATWTWDGRTRGVFLTVAGQDGATVDPKGDLGNKLLGALQTCGDPFVPIVIASYRPVFFQISAALKFDPDWDAKTVRADVEQTLRDSFGFAARDFGQGVAFSEVVAAIMGVAGVVAVDLKSLNFRGAAPFAGDRLPARMPVAGTGGQVTPAELLMLDPGPLDDVGVMP